MRYLVGLVAAIALVLAVAWVTRTRIDPEESMARSVAAADERPPSVSPASLPEHASGRETLEPGSEILVRAGGRVFVGDSGGAEWPVDSGFFVLNLDDGLQAESIAVIDGSWSAEMFAGRRYRIHGLSVDGLRARALDEWVVGGDEAHDIHAELLWDGRLRVLDATSDEELEGVMLAAARNARDAWLPYPPLSCASRPLALGPSPVSMPSTPEERTLWVMAAGHAWSRLTYVSREHTAVHRIGLGGSLEVERGIDRAGVQYLLRLLSSDGGVYAEERWPAEQPQLPLRFAGMACGTYTARLVEVARQGVETLASTADFEILPGRATRVFLETNTRAHDGSIEGTLTFPLEAVDYLPTAFELRLEGTPAPIESPIVLHSHEMQPLGAFTFAWMVERLPVGRYRARLLPLGFHQDFEVRTEETTHVRLEAMELAYVTVHGIHPDGTAAAIDSLLWSPTEGAAREWRTIDAGADTVRFAAMPGAILWSCRAVGYAHGPESLLLAPGPNDVVAEFRERPLFTLRLSLRSRGQDVPVSLRTWSTLELRSDVGRVVEVHPGGFAPRTVLAPESSCAEFRVDAVGEYEIRLPSIAGYLSVDPFAVQVRAGETSVAEIELSPVRE